MLLVVFILTEQIVAENGWKVVVPLKLLVPSDRKWLRRRVDAAVCLQSDCWDIM